MNGQRHPDFLEKFIPNSEIEAQLMNQNNVERKKFYFQCKMKNFKAKKNFIELMKINLSMNKKKLSSYTNISQNTTIKDIF